MADKKRSIKKSLIEIVALTGILIIIIFLLTNNIKYIGKHSIHEDAKRYATRHCLVFYPDTKKGKNVAKQIAKENKDNGIYDYSLVPYGDYYLVSYGNKYSYFVDNEFNEVIISEVNDEAKKIISDYLRYTVKKSKPDMYYDHNFMNDTYVDNLDLSSVSYSLSQNDLVVYFPTYEINVNVPLKYVQKQLGMNFGYDDELYVKPTYIDTNKDHPIICLTFDDGPKFWVEPGTSSSEKIVDELYKYDATATFFVIDSCLEDDNVWPDYEKYYFLLRSINQGNEYGSHGSNHELNFNDYESSEKIKENILAPNKYINKMFDIDMRLARPVGGIYDDSVLEASPYPLILWNIDSNDWQLESAKEIYDQVMKYDKKKQIYDGDVILFHDIYDETYETIKLLLPDLIDKGYQLVTVSEMLKACEINADNLQYYFSTIYFE